MSNSPESDLTTDGPSAGTSTSDEDADGADAPEYDVAPDPEPTSTPSSESVEVSDSDETGTLSAGGIANPPDMDATETTQPSNDSGRGGKAQTERKTDTNTMSFSGVSDGGEDTDSNGDGDGDGGFIFNDPDFTKWAFFGFAVFEFICASLAVAVLYAILSHGMHHTPWFLIATFGVLVFVFIATSLGGLSKASSAFSVAGQFADQQSNSQSNRHR